MQDPKNYEQVKASSAAADFWAEGVSKLVKLVEWDKTQELILDYGCGAGSTPYKFLLHLVEKWDSSLIGVDVSQNMIDFAQANYSHPKMSFVQGDILDFDKFPLKNEQFDKIFSVLVFHYIANLRKALQGLHEILKPGGQMAFWTVSMNGGHYHTFPIMGQSEKWGKYMKGYENFLPTWSIFEDGNVHKGMKALLEDNGFVVKHLTVEKQKIYYKTDDLVDLCFAANPYINIIPIELQNDYKNDYCKVMMDYYKLPYDTKELYNHVENIIAVVEKSDINNN